MLRPLSLAVVVAIAPVAVAQDVAGPTTASLDAIAATLPPQPWYPEGYYDFRVAAEAEVAENPRPATALLTEGDDGKVFDLVYCSADRVTRRSTDRLMQLYGNVALDTARLQAEFGRLHYPATVYAAPLEEFEKQGLIAAQDGGSPEPLRALVETLEANRKKLAPALPRITAGTPCPSGIGRSRGGFSRGGPGGESTIIQTEPSASIVLLLNAFAFKVCTRKVPNPWDQFACRWTEIEAGDAWPLSGRYVYQIRWPDGAIRRGTREILPDMRREVPGVVTIRKIEN